jgi:branched-chain amino acid transport system permease protein
MQSLVLGGVIGAFGGFMFALANSSIQPDNYSTLLTFFAFTAMILGGAGRILGPVIGAILFSSFFTFLENTLVQAVSADVIPTSIMNTNQVGIVRFILVGVLLMALMIFRPQGIFGDKKELALDAR